MQTTVEQSLIERAAAAVADYTGQRFPPAGDAITCEGIVRAVLQAIRTPSVGMLDAARGGAPSEAPPGLLTAADFHRSVVWQAMIDAALAD
jgi:hypothetical protein